MPAVLYKTGPAIADAEVDAFEVRIARSLPPDYRAFLLDHNGGRPEHHVIRNPETGDLGVKIFYGLRNEEYFDIDAENRAMEGRWPSRLLAFAIDSFGNTFCLSLEPPDCGCVYFWDHEQESERGEEPTESNLYRLANSFSEFWARIEPISRDEYLTEKGIGSNSESESMSSDPSSIPDTNGKPR